MKPCGTHKNSDFGLFWRWDNIGHNFEGLFCIVSTKFVTSVVMFRLGCLVAPGANGISHTRSLCSRHLGAVYKLVDIYQLTLPSKMPSAVRWRWSTNLFATLTPSPCPRDSSILSVNRQRAGTAHTETLPYFITPPTYAP
jgi:hypothetical protein